MAEPVAHYPVSARIVATLDGEDYDLATFDLDLPVHVNIGEQGVNEDGERYVTVHPYLSDDAVDKALQKVIKRRALAA